jgi:hypothetical protein
MRVNHFVPFVLLLFGLAGCQGSLESVPATGPPDKGPTLAAEASLRPHYQMGGKDVPAGTAFVVQDKSGKLYMLTAAHIMDNEAEWNQVQSVSLDVMGSEEAAKAQGRPTFIGKPFDKGNAGVDLVIWPLADGAKVAPLKLAAADAKMNEWVWVVGQEPGHDGPQKMYRCKVTGTEMRGIVLQQHDRFEMRGFSGGPIVNAQGEVIGSLLGGNAPTIVACKVSSIRERLGEAKIELP